MEPLLFLLNCPRLLFRMRNYKGKGGKRQEGEEERRRRGRKGKRGERLIALFPEIGCHEIQQFFSECTSYILMFYIDILLQKTNIYLYNICIKMKIFL